MGKQGQVARRASEDRGTTRTPWLVSRHTFSFGEYADSVHQGFRCLRVINEDHIAPGSGFGMHGHRDMEILTVVLSGAIEHRDSLGNGAVVRPGEVQAMTAGIGMRHSEFNPSASEPVHLLQIWIEPQERGGRPCYSQRCFGLERERLGLLRLAGPSSAEDDALAIGQDAHLFVAALQSGGEVSRSLAPGRGAWLQVLQGEIDACGIRLRQGDGCSVEGLKLVTARAVGPSRILLFDLPPWPPSIG